MTKKIVSIVVMVVVVISAVIWAAMSNRPNDAGQSAQKVVKIGLAIPLTGNLAFIGEPERKSAELALIDAGNTRYKYDLVFEDSQFSPVLAASAASKLINVDKVLAIIDFGSGIGDAIAPIAEKSQVAHFSLASDPTAAVGRYNYIHWTPPFKEGELLVKELKKGGYKKISIIDTNHPGTLAVTNSVKEGIKGSGIEITSYDLTNVGDKDFRTIIGKIKKAGPDIVILEMFSPEIEIAARQMKELGMKTPVTSVETFEWSDQSSLFEGDWFISDAVTTGFNEKYKTAYGSDPKPGSSYVYDLVTFLIKLQENSSEPIEAKDLPDVISKIGTYSSPVFGEIKIDKDGFFITEPSVKIIKDGKAVLVTQ